MRYAPPAAAFLFLSAWPALATGGFECRPVSGPGPTLIMGLGHSIVARPLFVILREGRRSLSTQGRGAPLAIGQIWIDNRYLWLDLTDTNANRHEAKLRAVFQPGLKERPAIGTLIRNGRTYRVRCLEG